MGTERGVAGRRRGVRTATGFVRTAGAGLLALVAFTMVVPRFTAIPYDRMPALLTFAVLLAAWAGACRLGPLPEPVARRLVVPLGVGCCVVAVVVGRASAYVTTWDAKLVQNIAALPPEQASAYQVAYLSRYPNNDALLALARLATGAAEAVDTDYATAFLGLLVAAFALTLAAAYLLATRLAGRTAGLAAMVGLTLLVGVSPWLAVPYTDVPAMWTPVWALYCFVRARRAGGLTAVAAWAAAGAAVLAVGYAVKTTPVVGLAAAAVWFAGSAGLGAWRRTPRAALAGGVAVLALAGGAALGLVGTGAMVARLADAPPTTPGVAASPWHYVAGGLRTQVAPNGNLVFGGYDRPVNVATFGLPTAEQARISKEFARAELQRRGVARTVWFELNKLGFTWGDGMLWAYGEGTDLSRRPLHHAGLDHWVQQWNAPTGHLFGARVAVTQGLWWFVLTLAAVGWLRGRVTADTVLVVLTLLGVAAFTLLFQGRSRYLIAHVPLLVVAATAWRAGCATPRDATRGWPGPRRRSRSPSR